MKKMLLKEQELMYAYLDGIHCKTDENERDQFTYNDLLYKHTYNNQVLSLFLEGYNEN